MKNITSASPSSNWDSHKPALLVVAVAALAVVGYLIRVGG